MGKWKRLGSLGEAPRDSSLGLYTSVFLSPVLDSEMKASCKPSLQVHADISKYCSVPAEEQGAVTGSRTMDIIMLSLLALENDRNVCFGLKPLACLFPGTCPKCQFRRKLPCCFLHQVGANGACHALRIKVHNLYWTV